MHCRVTDKAQTVLLDETLSLHSDGTYLRSRELVLSNITPWCHETPELYRVTLLEETQDLVSIRYTFTAPAMPGLKTEVTYTVDSNCMDVNVHYYGGAGRPQLPLLGLRFATPAPVEKVEWIGLSGETYPDRKKGGVLRKTQGSAPYSGLSGASGVRLSYRHASNDAAPVKPPIDHGKDRYALRVFRNSLYPPAAQ